MTPDPCLMIGNIRTFHFEVEYLTVFNAEEQRAQIQMQHLEKDTPFTPLQCQDFGFLAIPFAFQSDTLLQSNRTTD